MKIIISGAGGFVGRRLCHDILEGGHEVVAIDTKLNQLPAHSMLAKIEGDIADRIVLDEAFANECQAVIHLATIPGGAAENDPALARRINVDAAYDILERAAALKSRVKLIYASSIAVLGDSLPDHVRDETPINPYLIYGAQKAMIEPLVTCFSNRGWIDGVTLRLPGIVARPHGPSGLKSAFMSEIFHSLRAREMFVCPVSAGATIWIQSLECCAKNFSHALNFDSALLPLGRALTLPALRIRLDELVDEISLQTGADAGLIRYRPDPVLEAAFGAQPSLTTAAADRAGFRHDGTLRDLVKHTLAIIEAGSPISYD